MYFPQNDSLKRQWDGLCEVLAHFYLFSSYLPETKERKGELKKVIETLRLDLNESEVNSEVEHLSHANKSSAVAEIKGMILNDTQTLVQGIMKSRIPYYS